MTLPLTPLVALPTAIDAGDWSGAEYPLGAHYDPAASATTFAVAAPWATRVILELFSRPVGVDALSQVDLDRGPDGIWRARLANVGPGAHYGYRVWGPGWDISPDWRPGNSSAGFTADVGPNGERFNPNKVLTDPYAREISHSPASPEVTETDADAAIFGFGPQDYRGRPVREWDTARVAPKAIVIHDTTPVGNRPQVPTESTTTYEAHVRNLTLHPSARALKTHLASLPGFADVADVPQELQGTYAGAAYLAPYLKALGFTTLELLPVHESSGSELDTVGASNHWAYMTLGFFAPNRQYAHDKTPGGPTREFKEMVAAFHAAGIEVCLDVVYNHTGEGGNWGDRESVGFTSFGGFGTPDYYVLTDDGRLVDGATGCGNQTDLSSAVMARLVVESLKYWTDEMGVDGFRFDLAPVLGRMPDAVPREDWAAQRRFFPEHPLLTAISELAQKRGIDVIAEAWDLWGYEVGNFPDGWGEWNGHFRDAVRRFTKGDGNTGAFLETMNGDYRAFFDQGGPHRSVNFVTAHDGFTMMDLVSYDQKNNSDPWPFGPSDGGSDDNLSWGSGGDQALRRARLRNLWALLFLARGVPMIVSGDEFGRTQNGNNNPYALNTIGMWNNWSALATPAPTAVPVDPSQPDLHYHDVFGRAASAGAVNPQLVFAAYVARLRRDHPGLRQRSYGDTELGGTDVSYVFRRPDSDGAPAEGDRALRLWIDGSGIGAADLLVLINMAAHPVTFAVPQPPTEVTWRRLIDTSTTFEAGFNCWSPDQGDIIVGNYGAAPFSVVLLAEGGPGTPTSTAPAATTGPPPTSVLSNVSDVVVDAMTGWFRRRAR